MSAVRKRKQRSLLGDTGPAVRWDGVDYEDCSTGAAGVSRRRVVPQIDMLLRRKAITDRGYQAAEQLMRDYELGIEGARTPADDRTGGGNGRYEEGFRQHQIDAVTRYRTAIRSIDNRLSVYVQLIVLQGEKAQDVARQMGVGKDAVCPILSLGLEALADHYGY